jgi:hypothetical protein
MQFDVLSFYFGAKMVEAVIISHHAQSEIITIGSILLRQL